MNNSDWGVGKAHLRTPQLNVPSHLSQLSLLARTVEAKLEFESFLKLLELAAAKLFPDSAPAQGLERLIANHLLRLLSSVDYEPRVSGLHQITRLKGILADAENVRMMGIVQDNLQVYYEFYSDSKGHLNFDAYVRFFKDFEMFPRFISKAKLSNYFYTLAGLNDAIVDARGNAERRRAGQEQTEKEVLDCYLFTEAIVMVCLNIAPPGSSFPEAVGLAHQFLFGLQRLDSSQGPAVVQRQLGLTRGARGFNWSLLKGLEEERQAMLLDLGAFGSSRGSSRSIQQPADFRSVYNL